MIYRALYLAIAILGLAGPCPARAATTAQGTIHILYEDARVYVPVRINNSAVHWFILDTGATPTIIDKAFAAELGLSASGDSVTQGAGAGTSHFGLTRATQMLVGDTKLAVKEPHIMELAKLLGPTSGRAPAGIIGSQFFREHFVEIDFERQLITLFAPGTDRARHFSGRIPLTFNDWTPLADAMLTLPSGRAIAAHVLLDLGAKSTFLIPEPFIAAQQLQPEFPNPVVMGLGAGVGGDTRYAFARAKSLQVGPATLANPVVGLSVGGSLRSTWHQGLAGAEFLSRFRLGFDYANARLFIQPTQRAAEGFDRSGLFLVAEGADLHTIKVREVLAGAPGADAGLQVGDEITALDGQPVSAIGLPAVRAVLKSGAGRTIKIAYQRGVDTRTTNLTLRVLL